MTTARTDAGQLEPAEFEDPSEGRRLTQMLVGSWITQGIYVVAELGIADHLGDGPRSATELAAITRVDADSLYRVLRAVASIGVLHEDEQCRFSLTALGARLRSDVPGSQRAFAIMAGAECYGAWGGLLSGVKTGREPFRENFDTSWFEYMTRHPDRHAIFDAAMEGVHGPETEPMIEAYDFARFETVMDVGGGNGRTLAAILDRNPAQKGILFELPAVADRARKGLAALPVFDRMQIVGGDFFSSVPAGADAYVLRHVIHDWQDEKAATILRNCRNALGENGRLLVVETVIPPGSEPSFGKWLDLMMLIIGGRERTERQFRDLFARSGLCLTRIVPTAHEVSIIEGVRAD